MFLLLCWWPKKRSTRDWKGFFANRKQLSSFFSPLTFKTSAMVFNNCPVIHKISILYLLLRVVLFPSWQPVRGPLSLLEWYWLPHWSSWTGTRPLLSRYCSLCVEICRNKSWYYNYQPVLAEGNVFLDPAQTLTYSRNTLGANKWIKQCTLAILWLCPFVTQGRWCEDNRMREEYSSRTCRCVKTNCNAWMCFSLFAGFSCEGPEPHAAQPQPWHHRS